MRGTQFRFGKQFDQYGACHEPTQVGEKSHAPSPAAHQYPRLQTAAGQWGSGLDTETRGEPRLKPVSRQTNSLSAIMAAFHGTSLAHCDPQND